MRRSVKRTCNGGCSLEEESLDLESIWDGASTGKIEGKPIVWKIPTIRVKIDAEILIYLKG